MSAPPRVPDPTVPVRRKLQLTGEQETLVIPLYAKARNFRSAPSILHDRKADEVVRSFDFDFERLSTPGNFRVLAARARQFDEWVREFLAAQPRALVLNLGCGLDSRIERVRPPSSALWVDLDFPDVIDLRRSFFAETDGYRMAGTSITEPGWVENLPTDRPGLAVADGVFEYLEEAEVRTIVGRLTSHFAHGEVLLDTMSSFARQMGNERLQQKTTARLRWAVDDLALVDNLAPNWKRTGAVSALRSRFLPLRYRLLYAIATLSPKLRGTIRMLRYDF